MEIEIKEGQRREEEGEGLKGIVDAGKRMRPVVMADSDRVHACMVAANRRAHSRFAAEASTKRF